MRGLFEWISKVRFERAHKAAAQRWKQLHEQQMKAFQNAIDAMKSGGDYRHYLAIHHMKQLEVIQAQTLNMDVSHVRIISSGPGGHACPACQMQDGKIYKIKTEMRTPHLPMHSCTCHGIEDSQIGFCICYYGSVFDDEL